MTNRKNILRNEAGHVSMTIAVSLPVIIAALGLGLDTSMNYFIQQKLQNAVDQAALSAARARIAHTTNKLDWESEYILENSGFLVADGTLISVNNPPAIGPNTGSTSHIEVSARYPQVQFFSSFFGDLPTTLSARAVAKFSLGQTTCLLALEPAKDKAMNVSGGAQVNLENCDLQINSTNSKALSASGGAIIDAENAMITGGANLSGGAVLNTTGTTTYNAPALADPMAGQTIPSAGTCKATGYSTSSPATLDPGTYCDGLTISSGGDVWLNPGVYIIDRGKLTVSGGGKLKGNDVTIVFTSSTGANWGGAVFSGSSVVELHAPGSGTTAGFVMMGDRSMVLNTKFDFSGGSNQVLEGSIYIPKAFANWSGSSIVTVMCLNLIANTVQFSGSAAFAANDCDKYGTHVGAASVSLVE